MSPTLYEKLQTVDNLEETLKEYEKVSEALKQKDVPWIGEIDIGEGQIASPEKREDLREFEKKTMENYEGNPIFDDAIHSRQEITESLEKISENNQSPINIIPRRKDDEHNEKVDQMNELISVSDNFKKEGIYVADNFVTGGVYMGSIIYGLCRLACLLTNPQTADPEFERAFKSAFSRLFSALGGGLGGFGFGTMGSGNPPFEKAEYLDEKIEEYY